MKNLSIIESTISYLACPDDRGKLKISNNNLICCSCERQYKILNQNTVEILPKDEFEPKSLDKTTKSYLEYYSDLRNFGHSLDPKKRLFGIKTKTVPEGFVIKLRDKIKQFVGDKIVCDVGAGSGDYSLFLAKKSKLVFHCDLDLEAISTASSMALKQNLKNILFVRCNYFSLPFQPQSLPCIICIDALLRGREHDERVITEFQNKSAKNGIIIIDFHAKERIKINKNLDIKGCYSKNEIYSIIKKFNMKNIKIIGMGYAPTINKISKFSYKIANFTLKSIVPPARWLVVTQT